MSDEQRHHPSAYVMLGLGLAVSGMTLLAASVIRLPGQVIRRFRRRKQ
jgi:hypothetical protein